MTQVWGRISQISQFQARVIRLQARVLHPPYSLQLSTLRNYKLERFRASPALKRPLNADSDIARQVPLPGCCQASTSSLIRFPIASHRFHPFPLPLHRVTILRSRRPALKRPRSANSQLEAQGLCSCLCYKSWIFWYAHIGFILRIFCLFCSLSSPFLTS